MRQNLMLHINAAQHSVPEVHRDNPNPGKVRRDTWWESARSSSFLRPGWFRQSGIILSRPPAGNANRWAFETNGQR